jgi:hypothetical protein
VRGRDEASSRGERRARHTADTQRLERERHPADVGQRVDGAYLVEDHPVGRHAVHAPLGVRQAPERIVRARVCAGGQTGAIEQRANRSPVAVNVLLRGDDAHRRRR